MKAVVVGKKLLSLLVLIYLIWHTVTLIKKERELILTLGPLNQQIEEMEKGVAHLQEEYRFYTSPDGSEYFLRKELGYVKEGEVPLLLVQDSTKAEAPDTFSSKVLSPWSRFRAKLPIPPP